MARSMTVVDGGDEILRCAQHDKGGALSMTGGGCQDDTISRMIWLEAGELLCSGDLGTRSFAALRMTSGALSMTRGALRVIWFSNSG